MKLIVDDKKFLEAQEFSGSEGNAEIWLAQSEYLRSIEAAILAEAVATPEILMGDNYYHLEPNPFSVLNMDPTEMPPPPDASTENGFEEWRAACEPWGSSPQVGANVVESTIYYGPHVNPETRPFTYMGVWTDDCCVSGAFGVLKGDDKLTVFFC